MNKPKKTFTIIDAIQHKQVFGSLPAFASLDTWASWQAWLKAVFALPMDDSELAIFRQCTGRQAPPAKPPRECFTICGRRSGKFFVSSLTSRFIACFSSFRQHLTAGEQAVVLVLARDRDQAKIVFHYIKGILSVVAPLRAMVVSETADSVELDNGVTLMVKTSDFRGLRGLTIALCVADEVAFWDRQGVNPDKEIFTALRPAMATIPGSKLLCISTAYAKSGVVFEAHREHYGKDTDDVLV